MSDAQFILTAALVLLAGLTLEALALWLFDRWL